MNLYDKYFRINNKHDVCVKTTAQGENELIKLNYSNSRFCCSYNLGLTSSHIGTSIVEHIGAWLKSNRFTFGPYPVCFIDNFLIVENGAPVECFFAVYIMINHQTKEDGVSDICYIEEPAKINVIDNIEKHALIDKLFFNLAEGHCTK